MVILEMWLNVTVLRSETEIFPFNENEKMEISPVSEPRANRFLFSWKQNAVYWLLESMMASPVSCFKEDFDVI